MIAGTVLALFLLAYTYAGYPVCIGVLARAFPGRRRSEGRAGASADGRSPPPMISVCLPVSDGAAHLGAKVESLFAQDYPSDRIEILIHCDGCTDDSESIARALAASPPGVGRVRISSAPERRGKPTALNIMAEAARGDLLLLNDVRQPLSANAAGALARAMADDVGCAAGNLVLTGASGAGVYWRYENWIRRQESRFRGVIGMSGSIAMMRRADFTPLPTDLILDDVWIPMRLALQSKKRVTFVAEAEAYDTAFDDDREFGRKVRTLAGNYQLFAGMPALLNPLANPVWFETVSHKVLRLVAPWMMLWLAIASIAGACAGRGAMRLLLLAQIGFYAAALAGRRAGRLAGVARTFVVLNAAAVVGLFRQLAGRQRVTW